MDKNINERQYVKLIVNMMYDLQKVRIALENRVR